MVEQIISLVGAVMILLAFGAQQSQKMRHEDIDYILLNLIGSLILTVVALRVRQIGLTLMERAWALISVASLIRYLRKRQ